MVAEGLLGWVVSARGTHVVATYRSAEWQNGDVADQQELEDRKRRFEELAMPAVDVLYRQAMRLTNNPDDAQDLVQDTFERGFKAFDRFEPGSNFEAG